MEYAPINRRRILKSYVGFHIHNSNKSIIVIGAKNGRVPCTSDNNTASLLTVLGLNHCFIIFGRMKHANKSKKGKSIRCTFPKILINLGRGTSTPCVPVPTYVILGLHAALYFSCAMHRSSKNC